MVMTLTEADHQRITAAVAAAESGTSGEIRCVLADRRDLIQTAFVASAAALLLPGLLLLSGFNAEWVLGLTGGWVVIDPAPAQHLQLYIGAQAAVFLAAVLIGATPLGRWLTPGPLKTWMVRRAALAQFIALGLTHTRDRTGVLLYVSLSMHRAEVLADSGIWAAAPQESWDDVVALLVEGLKRGSAADGFVAAVERTGAILSAHLPPREDDRNELPDRLSEGR